ncbi:ATP-binding protein [Pontibacter qinzhouensis]|uniref:ATP-binding protein n=1 Tax=Pontibacter qinzhouensis TaxID=2603253 RepID=A0A5C8K308_9BACT|nr:ATP-binding protein [Pontibacter qinzhouensis]TXK44931.1 ATP-binding protein [Pontibacter qinzhouensis]
MLRISVTGPESTGKSTISEKLAQHYRTVWVPEYARSYISSLNRPYTLADIEAIAEGQLAQEARLEQHANNLLFADTDLLVLKIWSENAFGHCPPWIQEKLEQQPYNLYLLMGVDLPWEPDPQREHPHLRQYFYNLYKKELQQLQMPFVEISGLQEERFLMARKHVDKLIKNNRN